MRIFLIVLAIGALFSMYGLMNYYIGYRLWNSLGRSLAFLNKKGFWIGFWLLVISFPAAQLTEKVLPVVLHRYLSIIGSYWIAAMFYFFLLWLLIDLLRLINKFTGLFRRWFENDIVTSPALGLAVLMIVLSTVAYGTWNAWHPRVHKYNLTINKKVPNLKSLRIVMVSDIHLGTVVRTGRLGHLTKRVDELKPDLLLLAGDVVDHTIEPGEAKNITKIFGGINTRYGKFAVPGNHEYISGEIDNFVKYLKKGGVTVLRDSYVKVGDSFYVVGRDDAMLNRRGTQRKDLNSLLSGVDTSLPIIMMDHQPLDVQLAMKQKVDLQLSGHTHRGQLFPNNFLTDAIYVEDWGLFKKGAYHLIVSSGYGTWGPPIRTGNYPEVILIEVNFK